MTSDSGYGKNMIYDMSSWEAKQFEQYEICRKHMIQYVWLLTIQYVQQYRINVEEYNVIYVQLLTPSSIF